MHREHIQAFWRLVNFGDRIYLGLLVIGFLLIVNQKFLRDYSKSQSYGLSVVTLWGDVGLD